MPLTLPLAVCLLTAAPDYPAQENLGIPLRYLQSAAVALELLDTRECKYTFTNERELATDLRLIRRRYEELHDAPPLCDAIRFPDAAFCNEIISFNRAYRAWLCERQYLSPGNDWIADAILECDNLYLTWDTIRDLRCEGYYTATRRGAIKRLRDRIGPLDYYGGVLPPAVPVWRFNRID